MSPSADISVAVLCSMVDRSRYYGTFRCDQLEPQMIWSLSRPPLVPLPTPWVWVLASGPPREEQSLQRRPYWTRHGGNRWSCAWPRWLIARPGRAPLTPPELAVHGVWPRLWRTRPGPRPSPLASRTDVQALHEPTLPLGGARGSLAPAHVNVDMNATRGARCHAKYARGYSVWRVDAVAAYVHAT